MKKRGQFKYKKRAETFAEGKVDDPNTLVPIALDQPSLKYANISSPSHLINWLRYICRHFVTYFGESLAEEPFSYSLKIIDNIQNGQIGQF